MDDFKTFFKESFLLQIRQIQNKRITEITQKIRMNNYCNGSSSDTLNLYMTIMPDGKINHILNS